MNSALILQDVVYVVALLAIGYPLGCYIYKIYNGERVALMRIFAPLEQLLYRVMGVDEEQQMHAKKYASSVLWFSLFGFLIVMGLHLVQAWLPLNPEQLENTVCILPTTQPQALYPIQTGRHIPGKPHCPI